MPVGLLVVGRDDGGLVRGGGDLVEYDVRQFGFVYTNFTVVMS